MSFELPKLNYSYDALEPFIDAQTMEVHHTKHHQAYTDKFNAAIADSEDLNKESAEDIIANIDAVPEDIRTAVRNNGGGYINHNLFWLGMVPAKEGKQFLDTEIAQEINSKFGSQDKFQEDFSVAAATHFGSGWTWLVVNKEGELEIVTTSNQDSPLADGNTPVLAFDVWEHAYYLKYQNRRPEYIEAWWKVVNWEKVSDLYQKAVKR
jgi:superoxide dismutase, Fe-Mn family